MTLMGKRLLVTGANGFVGRVLCAEACARGHTVRAATRAPAGFDGGVENIVVQATALDWSAALVGMDVVVHLAARVHVMQDTSADPLEEFRKVNVEGTMHLARSAVAAGVQRFVYVSSIKVNGEETPAGTAYDETAHPHPQDPYGVSKWEAEQALHQLARETGLEVVVVRPPLVYGPGVKGNFIALMRAVAQGVPLPFGSIHNARDLIYVGNLADLLILCATHPGAAGQTYVVRDGEPLSTSELVRQLARALEVSLRMLPIPVMALELVGRMSGRSAQIARLVGSLRIDDDKIRRELGWCPPYSLQQGLQATANWFKTVKR